VKIGEVVYDERWLRGDPCRLRLDKIGFIFQYPNLLPFLDGSNNVDVVLHLESPIGDQETPRL